MWRWAGPERQRSNSSSRRALVLLAILTVLAGASASVSSGARSTIEREVLSSGGSTRIELSSIETGHSVRELNTENLDEARGLEHVAKIVPDHISTIYTGNSDPDAPTFDLTTHSWWPAARPSIVRGEIPQPLEPGQLVLPSRGSGVDFNRYVGEELLAAYTRATGERSGTPEQTTFEVVATYDPDWQLDGPDVAYAAPETTAMLAAAKAGMPPERYRSTTGATSAVVSVAEEQYVSAVAERLQRMGFSASPVADRVRNLPGVLGAAEPGCQLGILVLVVLAVAVLVGLSNTRSSVHNRLFGEVIRTGLLTGVLGSVVGFSGALLLRGPLEQLLGLKVSLTDMLPHPLWAVAVVLTPLIGLVLGALFGGRFAVRRAPRPPAAGQA
ncbi:putative ABC transport system permease protein [Actinopolyspora lacussalsi]|nr:putative ABC transport system permease protein [Actinopolyspora lacussalsi]